MAPIPMTREEYEAKFGVPAPAKGTVIKPSESEISQTPRKKTGLERAEKIVTTVFPGKQVGESIGTLAGFGIQKLKDIGKNGPKPSDFYNLNAPTPLQTAGDVASGALSVAGLKGLGPAKGLATKVLQEGALGAGFGAAQGVAEAKTGRQIRNQAIVGGAIGAAIPLAMGATKKILAGRASKSLQKIASEVADPLDKQAKVDILKATGKNLAGKEQGVKKTLISGRYAPVATPREVERALAVEKYVKPNKPLTSIANLNKGIDDISKKVVLPNLEQNPRAFNLQTLSARLNRDKVPLSIQSDETLKKTYDLAKSKMLEIADDNPKTMAGLWQSRKEFDSLIKREFGDLAFLDPRRSAVRRAVQDVRGAVNDYIAEEVGDDVFKSSMKQLSHMYDAIDNLAESNYKLLNSSRFQRLFKKYPKSFKLLGWGIVGTGALVAGKNAFAKVLSE